jgi:hypothetical protein
MKGLMVVIVLCGLAGAGLAATEAQLQRKTLAQSTELQGYECAKGVAWFYADGRLKECAVARDTDFGVARAPAGSWINLTRDGRPDFLFLVRDTNILGYACLGGNRLLGPTEGAMTGFYPSGKLKYCWLTADREVQGVACAGSGMFSGKSEVDFYEDGRLKGCKLAKDYGSLKAGERFSQSH